MDFSEALTAVKAGRKAYRRSWKERDLPWVLELIPPLTASDGRITQPILMISPAGGFADCDIVPFAGVSIDLLAGDWELMP